MCTYSQQKNNNKSVQPPPPPSGPMAPLMSQNCTRLAEKMSQNVLKVVA